MPREIDVSGYPERHMMRGSRTPPFHLILPAALAATVLVSPPARAQRTGPTASETTASQTEEQRQAQEHFQRAKELYSTGKYSEAIAELEVARNLDPKARDLVMN